MSATNASASAAASAATSPATASKLTAAALKRKADGEKTKAAIEVFESRIAARKIGVEDLDKLDIFAAFRKKTVEKFVDLYWHSQVCDGQYSKVDEDLAECLKALENEFRDYLSLMVVNIHLDDDYDIVCAIFDFIGKFKCIFVPEEKMRKYRAHLKEWFGVDTMKYKIAHGKLKFELKIYENLNTNATRANIEEQIRALLCPKN
jgi:hypothetical protein